MVREHHEDEQQPAGRRRYDEEIGGHDLVNVNGQEGPPRLGRRSPGPHEVFRDAGLTDFDAELQQLAVNARSAPEWVGLGHRADQGADVGWDCRTTEPVTAFPGPKASKGLPVPGDDGLRSDDNDGRSPLRPDPREPHPQEPVGLRQADTPTPWIDEELGAGAAGRESRVAAPRESAPLRERSEGSKSGARSSAGSVSSNANIINRCNQYGIFRRYSCVRRRSSRGRSSRQLRGYRSTR